MIEKVNPSHPDKIADRIAGALVDMAYMKDRNPKIAVEVLIGHGKAHIIAESSVVLRTDDINKAVWRIAGTIAVDYVRHNQDAALAENQRCELRCGDNGIFKGIPLTEEEHRASWLARALYDEYQSDGKYIVSRATKTREHSAPAAIRSFCRRTRKKPKSYCSKYKQSSTRPSSWKARNSKSISRSTKPA